MLTFWRQSEWQKKLFVLPVFVSVKSKVSDDDRTSNDGDMVVDNVVGVRVGGIGETVCVRDSLGDIVFVSEFVCVRVGAGEREIEADGVPCVTEVPENVLVLVKGTDGVRVRLIDGSIEEVGVVVWELVLVSVGGNVLESDRLPDGVLDIVCDASSNVGDAVHDNLHVSLVCRSSFSHGNSLFRAHISFLTRDDVNVFALSLEQGHGGSQYSAPYVQTFGRQPQQNVVCESGAAAHCGGCDVVPSTRQPMLFKIVY
eukprot:PhM_4_TR14117/c0_g1_i1/m.42896